MLPEDVKPIDVSACKPLVWAMNKATEDYKTEWTTTHVLKAQLKPATQRQIMDFLRSVGAQYIDGRHLWGYECKLVDQGYYQKYLDCTVQRGSGRFILTIREDRATESDREEMMADGTWNEEMWLKQLNYLKSKDAA